MFRLLGWALGSLGANLGRGPHKEELPLEAHEEELPLEAVQGLSTTSLLGEITFLPLCPFEFACGLAVISSLTIRFCVWAIIRQRRFSKRVATAWQLVWFS